MARIKTRQKILDEAANMFSEKGYSTVSVRDIANACFIKESTLYYHFENKRDILNTIIKEFETRQKEITDTIEDAISPSILLKAKPVSFDWIYDTYCEQFLFDPFCNKVMRILLLEQFNDIKIQAQYNECFFERTYKLNKVSMMVLEKSRSRKKTDDSEIIQLFNSFLISLIFKYLMNGPLTDQNKIQFKKELDSYCEKFHKNNQEFYEKHNCFQKNCIKCAKILEIHKKKVYKLIYGILISV